MKLYDHKKFDAYWQEKWQAEGLYSTRVIPQDKKIYILDMFPYPSGEGLHVGHPKGYIATDIYSRFKRMNGYDVLHPMGWDAFGLPAEQFALKNKIHPRIAVEQNIANFKEQLSHLGLDYDWKREINTTDPGFYKWTQWVFTKLYEKGLAYESFAPINWCPTCKTGLANEDLNGNLCERCDSVVQKKPLRQWVLKITDYADRMLADLDTLDWPEGVKLAQKNWIGRTEGVEFDFQITTPSKASFKFENKFIDDVLTGKKTMTIRLDVKGLIEGDFFEIKDLDGTTLCPAIIKKITVKKFHELDLTNSHGTSYGSKEEQLSSYKRYYGEEVTVDTIFYEVNFSVVKNTIRIFTTRADTLYGATFIAISPELASTWFDERMISGGHIAEYIKKTLEEEKQEADHSIVKEKTGVFTGVYAINPGTKEKIPVWIANYVMGGVGTGALMGVPAHDERDYDFAKKYDLPVKQVISPETGTPQNNPETRKSIVAILWNRKQNKFLSINWGKELGGNLFVGGGIDGNEDAIMCATREIKEETGYRNITYLRKTDSIHHNYFAHSKNVARRIEAIGLLFELVDETKDSQKLDDTEKGKFTVEWISAKEAESKIEDPLHALVYQMLVKEQIYTGNGTLINSLDHNGITSNEAKEKFITLFSGKKITKYKIQDWVFARQRYWGEPFPVVRDEAGKVYMVDESELPVLLPEVESYEPTGTGESPLAAIDSWVTVRGYITEKGTFKQSGDGKPFTRETNTMPQWAGSSWYYLRFMDPHNKEALVDKAIEKKWGPVDVYVGGDHATRHLIYARFWHKFLYDIGAVSTSEPFSRLEFLGFILAEDGRKMSKRWGNVINPNDVVNEYGADTLRVYEMFMAPFEQTAAWSTSSIKGADKFLDRVYTLRTKISDTSTVEVELHRTIKKVTEDIEKFKFNTAVSSMMILVNSMEAGTFTKSDYESLLQILAPFAPHLTEQLWNELGNSDSIHIKKWPEFDPSLLLMERVTIAFQVSGKLRGTLDVTSDIEDEELLELLKNHEMYQKYVGNQGFKKAIIVKNKIVNIVI